MVLQQAYGRVGDLPTANLNTGTGAFVRSTIPGESVESRESVEDEANIVLH